MVLDQRFDGGEIEDGAGHGFQQLERIGLVGGDVAGAHVFGMTEKISLKQGEAVTSRGEHLHASFDFLREHAAILAGELLGEGCILLKREFADVDFDEVHVRSEGFPRIGRHKVVESKAVALLAEALAGGVDDLIGPYGLLNLDDDFIGRQEQEIVLQQHLMSAVDEGETSVANGVESGDIQAVDGARGCVLCIGAKVEILGSRAKQQFVAYEFLFAGNDRLPREPRIWLLGRSLACSVHDLRDTSAGWREELGERISAARNVREVTSVTNVYLIASIHSLNWTLHRSCCIVESLRTPAQFAGPAESLIACQLC